jgi:hypothetical protein
MSEFDFRMKKGLARFLVLRKPLQLERLMLTDSKIFTARWPGGLLINRKERKERKEIAKGFQESLCDFFAKLCVLCG